MHTIPSQVDHVTVYRQGARVTRRAEIPRPAEGWPPQLRLIDLPLTLQDASVSARLEFPQGGGGFVARELRVELEPDEQPKPRDQHANLSLIKHQLTLLQARLDRMDSDIEKMKRLQPGTLVVNDTQAPGTFPLGARRAVVELRQRTLAEWLPQRNQLLQQRDALQQQINATLACAQPPPLKLRKSVVVSLYGKSEAQASHIRLLFTYQIEGAGWLPGYSLRFDRDYTLAQLELRALVCQSSGEDWTDVKLSVSTADPESWTELPQLQSWRVGRQQSWKLPGWRPLPAQSEALLADYDGTVPSPRPAVSPILAPPPPFLSDEQAAAVVMMCLPPDLTTELFQELEPEEVQCLTSVISSLPHVDVAEREAAADYVVGLDCDLTQHARQYPGLLVARLRQLLESGREASQVRPSPPRAPESRVACMVGKQMRMADLCDLTTDNSVRSFNTLESLSRVGPSGVLIKAAAYNSGSRRTVLSLDRLAFDQLYLPGADEEGRGCLQLQSPVQSSLKGWKDPASQREAERVLERALSTGRAAAHSRAPGGYSKPEAVKSQDWLYHGESRLSVASDAQFHSLPLLRRQLPSNIHWLVVPKVTCDVFRRVELECPADLALPAGPVDLFVGSDYLSCVQLPPVAAGESFPLDMGVETAVRVVRNATFKEQTAGIMGATLHLRHEIQIEAANHLNRPVRLQVREPLPQSAQSDCKVRLESNWQSLAQEEGYFHWLSLAPGQRGACNFTYCIEMSTRLELVGGNRREK